MSLSKMSLSSKHIIRVFTLLIGLCLIFTSRIKAEDFVAIKIDGTPVTFTQSLGRPYIDDHNRTQVPVRLALESYGAEVGWNADSQLVEVTYGSVFLEIPIGQKQLIKNGRVMAIDTAALIRDQRTYLPIRCVIEALGGKVEWAEAESTVIISHENTEKLIVPYALGLSTHQILAVYGEPDEKLASAYGFDWWVYKNAYDGYRQLGVYKGVLEAILITKDEDDWPYDIRVGMSLHEAETFGVSKNYSGDFLVNNLYFSDTCTSIIDGEVVLWPFIDDLDGDRIHSLIAVRSDYRQRWSLDGYADIMGIYSYERQIFNLTNVFRVSKGLRPMTMDEALSEVARGHSEDMDAQNYFAHTNQEGLSPFDRMASQGITYTRASENIAFGQSSALNVMDAWINSEGHRWNIISDFESMGVGVSENLYYTQDFISGP